MQRLAIVPDLARPPRRAGARAGTPRRGRAAGPRRGGRAVAQRLGAEVDGARGAEVGRQVAAGDLAGGPPQRAARHLAAQPPAVGASSPRELGAQVQRRAAGEEQTSHHRPERRRVRTEAEVGGDRLGDRVGLLRGEAALLDREGRRVARGVDAGDAGTRPCASTGMKPRASAGRPASAGPSERGHADDRVGAQRLSGLDVEQPLAHLQRRVLVSSATPRASSISRNAAPAAAPKIRSGSSSGVTSESVAFLTPRSRRSTAAIIASS